MLRLAVERLLERNAEGWGEQLHEVEAPTMELKFRYGNVVIDAHDPRERFFVSADGELRPVERHHAVELAARRVLESFGAVELECVDHLEPPIDSSANYLLQVQGDVHDYCSFGAYVLPQLRGLGWEVSVDESYPYAVVDCEAPWYAAIDEQRNDWFNVELGVVVGRERVSLLPALLELLRRCPDDTTLRALLRRPLRFFALPTGDGRLVPVSAERLKTVLIVLRDLIDGTGSPTIRFPMIRAATLTALEGQVQWYGGERARQRARRLRAPIQQLEQDTPPAAQRHASTVSAPWCGLATTAACAWLGWCARR